MKPIITLIALSLLTIISLPTLASAEGFLDVYGGVSFFEPGDVRISSQVATNARHVRFKDEPTYGIRSGYWFKNVPWLGVGGDVSLIHARGQNVKLDLAPFTPMALFRLPLYPDEGAPQGRLQPYVGIGPSLSMYTYASANFGPPTNGIQDWNINWGYQIPAGLAVQLTPHLALFGEYRYCNYRVKVTRDDGIFHIDPGPDDARDLQTRLQVYDMLFGLSFRF